MKIRRSSSKNIARLGLKLPIYSCAKETESNNPGHGNNWKVLGKLVPVLLPLMLAILHYNRNYRKTVYSQLNYLIDVRKIVLLDAEEGLPKTVSTLILSLLSPCDNVWLGGLNSGVSKSFLSWAVMKYTYDRSIYATIIKGQTRFNLVVRYFCWRLDTFLTYWPTNTGQVIPDQINHANSPSKLEFHWLCPSESKQVYQLPNATAASAFYKQRELYLTYLIRI